VGTRALDICSSLRLRAKGMAKHPAEAPATALPRERAGGVGESVPPVSETTTKPARRATAETMASRQREISVSEFFTKNRHLLGFDNPAKALLTTIKEAVDNS